MIVDISGSGELLAYAGRKFPTKDEAREKTEKALKSLKSSPDKPAHVSGWLKKIKFYIDNNQYDLAIQYFNGLIFGGNPVVSDTLNKNPELKIMAYTLFGEAILLGSKDLDAAREKFNAALELNPEQKSLDPKWSLDKYYGSLKPIRTLLFLRLAQTYLWQTPADNDKALTYLNKAQEYVAGAPWMQAELHFELGNAYLGKALELKSKNENNPEWKKIMEQAKTYFEKAKTNCNSIKSSTDYDRSKLPAKIAAKLASIEFNIGNKDTALKMYSAINTDHMSNYERLEYTDMLAVAGFNEDNKAKRELLLNKSLNILGRAEQTEKDKLLLSKIKFLIGKIKFVLGDQLAAREYFTRAIRLIEGKDIKDIRSLLESGISAIENLYGQAKTANDKKTIVDLALWFSKSIQATCGEDIKFLDAAKSYAEFVNKHAGEIADINPDAGYEASYLQAEATLRKGQISKDGATIESGRSQLRDLFKTLTKMDFDPAKATEIIAAINTKSRSQRQILCQTATILCAAGLENAGADTGKIDTIIELGKKLSRINESVETYIMIMNAYGQKYAISGDKKDLQDAEIYLEKAKRIASSRKVDTSSLDFIKDLKIAENMVTAAQESNTPAKLDEAEKLVKQMLEKITGKTLEASDIVALSADAIAKDPAQAPALVLKAAKLRLQNGDAKTAAALAKLIIDNPEAKMVYAEAQTLIWFKNPGAALDPSVIEILKQLAGSDNNLVAGKANLLLAKISIISKKPEDAVKPSETAETKFKSSDKISRSYQAYLLADTDVTIGEAYLGLWYKDRTIKDYAAKAEAALKRSLATTDDVISAKANILLAGLFAAQDKLTEAESHAQNATAKSKKVKTKDAAYGERLENEANFIIAESMTRKWLTYKSDVALRRAIDTRLITLKDSSNPYIKAKANYWLGILSNVDGKFAQAQTYLTAALESLKGVKDMDTSREEFNIKHSLADAYNGQGNYGEAAKILTEISAKASGDEAANINLELAISRASSENRDLNETEVIASLNKLAGTDGKTGIELANAALNKSKQNPKIIALVSKLAKVYLEKGEFDLAASIAEIIMDKSPDAKLVYAESRMLSKKMDKKAADALTLLSASTDNLIAGRANTLLAKDELANGKYYLAEIHSKAAISKFDSAKIPSQSYKDYLKADASVTLADVNLNLWYRNKSKDLAAAIISILDPYIQNAEPSIAAKANLLLAKLYGARGDAGDTEKSAKYSADANTFAAQIKDQRYATQLSADSSITLAQATAIRWLNNQSDKTLEAEAVKQLDALLESKDPYVKAKANYWRGIIAKIAKDFKMAEDCLRTAKDGLAGQEQISAEKEYADVLIAQNNFQMAIPVLNGLLLKTKGQDNFDIRFDLARISKYSASEDLNEEETRNYLTQIAGPGSESLTDIGRANAALAKDKKKAIILITLQAKIALQRGTEAELKKAQELSALIAKESEEASLVNLEASTNIWVLHTNIELDKTVTDELAKLTGSKDNVIAGKANLLLAKIGLIKKSDDALVFAANAEQIFSGVISKSKISDEFDKVKHLFVDPNSDTLVLKSNINGNDITKCNTTDAVSNLLRQALNASSIAPKYKDYLLADTHATIGEIYLGLFYKAKDENRADDAAVYLGSCVKYLIKVTNEKDNPNLNTAYDIFARAYISLSKAFAAGNDFNSAVAAANDAIAKAESVSNPDYKTQLSENANFAKAEALAISALNNKLNSKQKDAAVNALINIINDNNFKDPVLKAKAHKYLALIYMSIEKDAQKAENELAEAQKILSGLNSAEATEELDSINLEYARVLSYNKKYDDADKYYRLVLSNPKLNDREKVSIGFEFARVLTWAHKGAEALTEYNKAAGIKAKDDNLDILGQITFGDIQLSLGNISGSIKAYENAYNTAEKTNATNLAGEAALKLAALKLSIGDTRGAKKYIEIVKAIDPFNENISKVISELSQNQSLRIGFEGGTAPTRDGRTVTWLFEKIIVPMGNYTFSFGVTENGGYSAGAGFRTFDSQGNKFEINAASSHTSSGVWDGKSYNIAVAYSTPDGKRIAFDLESVQTTTQTNEGPRRDNASRQQFSVSLPVWKPNINTTFAIIGRLVNTRSGGSESFNETTWPPFFGFIDPNNPQMPPGYGPVITQKNRDLPSSSITRFEIGPSVSYSNGPLTFYGNMYFPSKAFSLGVAYDDPKSPVSATLTYSLDPASAWNAASGLAQGRPSIGLGIYLRGVPFPIVTIGSGGIVPFYANPYAALASFLLSEAPKWFERQNLHDATQKAEKSIAASKEAIAKGTDLDKQYTNIANQYAVIDSNEVKFFLTKGGLSFFTTGSNNRHEGFYKLMDTARDLLAKPLPESEGEQLVVLSRLENIRCILRDPKMFRFRDRIELAEKLNKEILAKIETATDGVKGSLCIYLLSKFASYNRKMPDGYRQYLTALKKDFEYVYGMLNDGTAPDTKDTKGQVATMLKVFIESKAITPEAKTMFTRIFESLPAQTKKTALTAFGLMNQDYTA